MSRRDYRGNDPYRRCRSKKAKPEGLRRRNRLAQRQLHSPFRFSPLSQASARSTVREQMRSGLSADNRGSGEREELVGESDAEGTESVR